MSGADVNRENDSWKYLREKVQGSDYHLTVLKPSPQNSELIESLTLNHITKDMCPAVKFQHLYVIQTFTCSVNTGILLSHKHFLKFSLNASKTQICDERYNEDRDSSEKTFSQVREQNNKANHEQKR